MKKLLTLVLFMVCGICSAGELVYIESLNVLVNKSKVGYIKVYSKNSGYTTVAEAYIIDGGREESIYFSDKKIYNRDNVISELRKIGLRTVVK